MSGGSLDYAYGKLDTIASDIGVHERARWAIPFRNALARVIRATVQPAHDLEWWLSGDTGPYEFVQGCAAMVPELEAAIADLNAALATVTFCDCDGGTTNLREVETAPGSGRTIRVADTCAKCDGRGFTVVG